MALKTIKTLIERLKPLGYLVKLELNIFCKLKKYSFSLFKYFMPRDNLKIYKRGNHLRIDFGLKLSSKKELKIEPSSILYRPDK